jgi:serine/threonine-protein kinase
MTDDGGLNDTLPSSAEDDHSLDKLSAIALGDLLLLSLVRRRAAALFVEPVAKRHGLRYEQGGATVTLSSLDAALGDALVARLALLCNLDLTVRDEQVGRLRVRAVEPAVSEVFAPVHDILLVLRATPRGLSAELRRLSSAEDASRFDEVAGESGALTSVGPYRILGELGRGGMGVVYRAEHVVLQRAVAIKVLHAGSASTPEAAAHLIAEARAACRAHHPGIVDVYDVGRLPSRRAFLVMELVDGPALEAIIKRGPLPPSRALDIAAQVAAALDAAAHKGVIHRDVKPANILVGKDGRVKIGDFGVAELTREGAVQDERIVGTIWYMSPEQALGQVVDARSDLYSLGCVLFEMLTGRVPFTGESAAQVLEQQANAPVPPIVTPEGPLPEAIERVVKRAMAKRPEERYQSAMEMLADLTRASHVLMRTGWRRWLP